MTTEQLLEMSFWQYNAWCSAYGSKQKDLLAIQLQAAYYTAYWNNAKQSRSLKSVLKDLDEPVKNKPMNVKKIADRFRQFEELQKYGRTQIECN